MNAFERRQELLEYLCQKRYDTYDNLAIRFHVSKMTIRRDIEKLMLSYPILTIRGRYGCDKVEDWYNFNYRHRTLSSKQIAPLRRLRAQLTGDDLNTINSILGQFSPYLFEPFERD